jgi:hypothetical protein
LKTLSYAVILLLCCAFPTDAAQVYSGCATPPSTFRHVWYIDPIHGKTQAAGANGSHASPWNSLAAVVSPVAGYQVDGVNAPLLSTVPYYHFNPATKTNEVWTNGTGQPIEPGDEILLMNGNYGNISVSVSGHKIANSEFVTVAAAPSQTPVLSTLFVGSTTNWVFDGLKVESLRTSSNANPLIYVRDGGSSFPIANIAFENMTVSSTNNAEAWSQAQWVANARSGIAVISNGGTNTKCISFTGSRISNVRFGASLMASQLVFSNNQIDHFGDDGIDYAASELAITKNSIHDSLNIGDGFHKDAMQGQIGVLAPGATVNHFQNILIDRNVVIRQKDRELAFPGYLQGIDAFDSDWTNVTVTNNVVITSGTCWGIGFGSLHNSRIVNNTVVDDGLIAAPGCAASVWVVDTTRQGAPNSNTVVRNNLASRVWVYNLDSGVEADHNVAMLGSGPEIAWHVNGAPQWLGKPGTYANGNIIDSGGPTSEFVDFDPSRLTYNVMLKYGAPAISAGTATGAPTVDMLGVVRAPQHTAAAYSYPK